MTGPVVIDSNVLVLLIVGGTSRDYVAAHKNTRDRYDADDYDLLTMLVKDFSEIIVVPHVVAETSNLVRQIGDPRQTEIQRVFARFIAEIYELPVPSVDGLARVESIDLGVTDAVLLHLCSVPIGDRPPTLLTIDGPLTDRAMALGINVINYERLFKS